MIQFFNFTLKLAEKIALDAPKVEFTDAVVANAEVYSMNMYSKWVNDHHNLKTSDRKLFAFLRVMKYLMHGRSPAEKNLPYQRYINDGTFVVKSQKLANGDIISVTHVTAAGAVKILSLLKKHASVFEQTATQIERLGL